MTGKSGKTQKDRLQVISASKPQHSRQYKRILVDPNLMKQCLVSSRKPSKDTSLLVPIACSKNHPETSPFSSTKYQLKGNSAKDMEFILTSLQNEEDDVEEPELEHSSSPELSVGNLPHQRKVRSCAAVQKRYCESTSKDDDMKSGLNRKVETGIQAKSRGKHSDSNRDRPELGARIGGAVAERKIFWMLRVAGRRQAFRSSRGYSKQPKDFAKRHYSGRSLDSDKGRQCKRLFEIDSFIKKSLNDAHGTSMNRPRRAVRRVNYLDTESLENEAFVNDVNLKVENGSRAMRQERPSRSGKAAFSDKSGDSFANLISQDDGACSSGTSPRKSRRLQRTSPPKSPVSKETKSTESKSKPELKVSDSLKNDKCIRCHCFVPVLDLKSTISTKDAYARCPFCPGAKPLKLTQCPRSVQGIESSADETESEDEDAFPSQVSTDSSTDSETSDGCPIISNKVRKRKHLNVNLVERLESLDDPLEEARRCLLVCSTPEILPCRDDEFDQIRTYVKTNLDSKTGGCIYISGVPGTGKTAVTHQVVRDLMTKEKGVPKFVFVDINAMKLSEPNQVFAMIYDQICKSGTKNGTITTSRVKTSASVAARKLEQFFSDSKKKYLPIVLLIDEIDLLWTKKQELLYQIFEWSTYTNAQLTVLAIANTMDLPERALSQRVASRLGMMRVSYQPYTFQQLEEIMKSRLKGSHRVVESTAMQLVARKVAAVSGDARRALELCRRAVDVAILSGDRIVKIAHVNGALQETNSCVFMLAIKNSSLHEKIFLRAAITEFKKTGVEDLTLASVIAHHIAYCLQEEYPCPSFAQLALICDKLAAMRLVVCAATGASKRGHFRKLRLNVSPEDILLGLD